VRLGEVVHFGTDVVFGKAGVEELGDIRGLGEGGVLAEGAGEEPEAVDVRVPVEGAVEDRVELAGGLDFRRVVHDVVELVGVLAVDVVEDDGDEVIDEVVGVAGGHGKG
jgi:hypothetical protein